MRKILRVLSAGALVSLAAPIWAGDAPSKAIPLEEVIVTAQKRQESLQNVPISISVMSGQDLDRSIGEGVNEALTLVPGITLTESWQNGTQISLRGVAASGYLLAGSSPVAYYIDSVPFGFVKSSIGPDTSAYDLERVEVLRGPQGTLYGANALNGVVRVLTNDPKFDEFEFKARTSVSGTKGGSESYRGDLAFNVPLVNGKLAARAVLGYADFGGWIDKPNRSDANDRELSNIRLKINGQPTERLTVSLSGWRSRADAGALSIGDEHDQYPGVLNAASSTDFDILGLKLGYEFDAFSVSSMTSHIDFANHGDVDLSSLALGSQYNAFDSEVLAQEFILSSTDTQESEWRWSLGGFYRDAEDRFFQRAVFFVPDVDYGDLSKSFAVFGELTRTFLDGRLELTGGMRYFEDEVTQRIRNSDAVPDEINTFDNVSPRVVLTWYPSDRLTAYASYAEGFRSGFNQTPAALALAPDLVPVKEDKLNNYEVGVKGRFWDGRVKYDAAVYYIDWQDVQQQVCITDLCFVGAANGESASGPGVDFSMGAQPVGGLELGVSFSWNDLTMDSDVFSNGALLLGKGDRLRMSSEYTVGGSVGYAFPIGVRGLEAQFKAAANYGSKLFSPRSLTTAGDTRQIPLGDSSLTTEATFSLSSPDHWTVDLFVDNITNYRGTYERQALEFITLRQRPRVIGLQVEYHY